MTHLRVKNNQVQMKGGKLRRHRLHHHRGQGLAPLLLDSVRGKMYGGDISGALSGKLRHLEIKPRKKFIHL